MQRKETNQKVQVHISSSVLSPFSTPTPRSIFQLDNKQTELIPPVSRPCIFFSQSNKTRVAELQLPRKWKRCGCGRLRRSLPSQMDCPELVPHASLQGNPSHCCTCSIPYPSYRVTQLSQTKKPNPFESELCKTKRDVEKESKEKTNNIVRNVNHKIQDLRDFLLRKV